MLSYPPPENRGKYLAYWLAYRNSGAILGGAINLAFNYSGKRLGKLDWKTYIVFVVLRMNLSITRKFDPVLMQYQNVSAQLLPCSSLHLIRCSGRMAPKFGLRSEFPQGKNSRKQANSSSAKNSSSCNPPHSHLANPSLTTHTTASHTSST